MIHCQTQWIIKPGHITFPCYANCLQIKKGFRFYFLKPLLFLSPRQGSNLRPID